MADFTFQDLLAGLTGNNSSTSTPATLDELLAGANKAAIRQGLLGFGFGALAGRGNLGNIIGNAGLLGLNQAQEGRQHYLGENMQALQAARQMNFWDQAQREFSGGQSDQGAPPPSSQIQPQAAVSPRTAASFGPAGNTAGFQNLPPTPPPSVPQGTPPEQIAGYQPPNWRQEMPRAGLAMGFASGDPKALMEQINKFAETKIGPDGTVTTVSGRPLYKPTEYGIQFFNHDGTPGRFIATGQANTEAAAARNAQIKAQETAAVERAKAPFNIVETQDAQGRPIKGYQTAIFGQPPGGDISQSPQLGLPSGANLNLKGPVAPGDLQRALADANAQQPANPALGSPFSVGPNPVTQRAAEANAQSMAGVYAKQHEKIDADAEAAGTLRARLAQMNEILTQFSPNMGAPVRQQIAEIGYAMGVPDAIIKGAAGGDLAAMQEFRKHAVQMAFEAARNQMGGVPRAWMELKTQLEANPSASLTPEANKAIMAFMDGMAQRTQVKQEQRDNWLVTHPDLKGFEGSFAKDFPASKFLPDPKQFSIQQAAVAPPAAAVSALRANPQLRNQFDAKYGMGASAGVLGR